MNYIACMIKADGNTLSTGKFTGFSLYPKTINGVRSVSIRFKWRLWVFVLNTQSIFVFFFLLRLSSRFIFVQRVSFVYEQQKITWFFLYLYISVCESMPICYGLLFHYYTATRIKSNCGSKHLKRTLNFWCVTFFFFIFIQLFFFFFFICLNQTHTLSLSSKPTKIKSLALHTTEQKKIIEFSFNFDVKSRHCIYTFLCTINFFTLFFEIKIGMRIFGSFSSTRTWFVVAKNLNFDVQILSSQKLRNFKNPNSISSIIKMHLNLFTAHTHTHTYSYIQIFAAQIWCGFCFSFCLSFFFG